MASLILTKCTALSCWTSWPGIWQRLCWGSWQRTTLFHSASCCRVSHTHSNHCLSPPGNLARTENGGERGTIRQDGDHSRLMARWKRKKKSNNVERGKKWSGWWGWGGGGGWRAVGVDWGSIDEGDERRNHKLSTITASGSAIHNEWLCSEWGAWQIWLPQSKRANFTFYLSHFLPLTQVSAQSVQYIPCH